jgi:MerR family copper efflux transcriptional regulator
MTSATTLRSSELARLAGVSTDTLRHYERVGVLNRPQRTAGGYRQYPPEALQRTRLVRQALAVRFSLGELAKILSVRDRGGAPCRQVRALGAAKLQQVERELADLIGLRDGLRALLKDWDKRLAGRRAGGRARLLESLADSSKKLPQRKGRLR